MFSVINFQFSTNKLDLNRPIVWINNAANKRVLGWLIIEVLMMVPRFLKKQYFI